MSRLGRGFPLQSISQRAKEAPVAAPALDDFNRANGALGSNWTADVKNGGLAMPQIVSNQVDVGTDSSAWWDTAQFGPDTEVSTTVTEWSSGNNQKGIHLFARLSAPGTAGWGGYEAWFTVDTGSGSLDTAVVGRVVGGSATFPAVSNPTKYQVGDELKLEVIGADVTLSRKRSGSWSVLLSYTDPSPITGTGYVGFLVDDGFGLDDFDASPEVVVTAYERSAAIGAAGAIAASASFYSILIRTAAVSATAAIATVPQRVLVRAASLTATGGLATVASFYSILTRAATVAATAAIATGRLIISPRQAAVGATGSITAAGVIEGAAQTHERTTALAAAGQIAASGVFHSILERAAAVTAGGAISSSGESETPVPAHERAADLAATATLAAAGVVESPLPAGYIDFPNIGLITRPVGGQPVRGGQGSITEGTKGALT